MFTRLQSSMLAVRSVYRRRLLCRGTATVNHASSDSAQLPESLLATSPSTAQDVVEKRLGSSTAPPAEGPEANSITADKQLPSTSSETTNKTGKRVFYPRRRPNISLENPRKWNPPVKKGLIHAYDEAVKYIHRDSARLRGEMSALKKQVLELEVQSVEDVEAREQQLRVMREKIGILQVQSYVNLPEVRWKAANGMGKYTDERNYLQG